MALETTKTTYLNGSSKDGNRVLANFSSSLSESGTMTINETISESTNLDTVEADFDEFRQLAKNELKKLSGQDTEADVSSDKPVDKEAAATTSDDKPAGAITKADDKPETDTPNEAKASDVKDGEEVKQPVASEEVKQPSSPVSPVSPVASEETKQPVVNEETKQPAESEEIKQPASSEEVKVSDVKDGENVDESNQLRHQ